MKFRFLLALLLCFPAWALADSSALIIRGVAGSPEHETKFDKWTVGTHKALVDKFGFSPDRVIVAEASPGRPVHVGPPASAPRSRRAGCGISHLSRPPDRLGIGPPGCGRGHDQASPSLSHGVVSDL